MNDRDTLMEFVQWLANEPSRASILNDAIQDDLPEEATDLIDEFLGVLA